jgi:hypothetical protein
LARDGSLAASDIEKVAQGAGLLGRDIADVATPVPSWPRLPVRTKTPTFAPTQPRSVASVTPHRSSGH